MYITYENGEHLPSLQKARASKVIIANPIYDVAFKLLMDNNRVAKFFVGTILGCEVVELTLFPQEHPHRDRDTGKVTLLRMDFSATVKTAEGEKQVIIEMQKARQLGDVFRFRRYLGREYSSSKLPIVSIYILGFDLSVDSPAFAARPDCRDLRTNEALEVNDAFVEHLTHSAYFIQALRIKPNYGTRLEKLLAVFEQANFIGDSTTTKGYQPEPEDSELRELVDILRYAAADEETRRELDEEEYYTQAMDEMFGEKDRELIKTKKDLEESKSFQRKTAKFLKDAGFSPEKISEETGVPLEDIGYL